MLSSTSGIFRELIIWAVLEMEEKMCSANNIQYYRKLRRNHLILISERNLNELFENTSQRYNCEDYLS